MSLGHILLLLMFQLLGEFLHRYMLVPLSGPLLGMALFFLALVLWGGPSPGLQATTRPLLANLALLFVPAGVGVIGHLDVLTHHWFPILIATVGGAVVSLLATAGTMLLIERLITVRLSAEPGGIKTSEVPVSSVVSLRGPDGDRP